MKNLVQKTSRKPKKTKKTIFQDSWKRKNAKIKKTSRKPKKTKKTIFQDSWKSEKRQKSKKPRENQKKQKKQYSRSLEMGSTDKSSGILFFFVFFGFLEVFLIFAFFLFQESWNIVFFVFFVFFGFLEVFWVRFFMMKMHYILDDVY